MSSASPSSQPLASSSAIIPIPAADFAPQSSIAPNDSPALPRFRHTRFPAGAIVKSLLTTMCGGAMLLTAAAVLDPAALKAESPASADAAPARQAHREFLRSLTAMLTSCEQLLLVRDRQEDRGSEVILWFEDAHDPGHINADELALLRHSPLFQTITVYTASKATGVEAWRPEGVDSRVAQAPSLKPQAFAALTLADIAAPGFIDRWRAASSVQARVLATAVTEMRVEGVEAWRPEGVHARTLEVLSKPPSLQASKASLSAMRVHLRWAGDSVDGGDEASAVMELKTAN